MVDATFSPPPLADPFEFGVDCILHSGSKYLGGHSDLLAGVLVVPTVAEWTEVSFKMTCIMIYPKMMRSRSYGLIQLWTDRTFLGSVLVRKIAHFYSYLSSQQQQH